MAAAHRRGKRAGAELVEDIGEVEEGPWGVGLKTDSSAVAADGFPGAVDTGGHGVRGGREGGDGIAGQRDRERSSSVMPALVYASGLRGSWAMNSRKCYSADTAGVNKGIVAKGGGGGKREGLSGLEQRQLVCRLRAGRGPD